MGPKNNSVVPTGLSSQFKADPALTCWATFSRPPEADFVLVGPLRIVCNSISL